MNKLLGGVFGLLLIFSSGASAMINNLFISEYVEGSGYNKAIELYNGTEHTIDLSEYKLSFYLNGSATPSLSVPLHGYLTSNTTYVVANALASSEILIVTDQTHEGIWFDGDDVVALTRQGHIVDSFGQLGSKLDSNWSGPRSTSKNRTHRRIAGVAKPDTNIHDSMDFTRQWQSFELNNFDGLGNFVSFGFSASARVCTEHKKELNYC